MKKCLSYIILIFIIGIVAMFVYNYNNLSKRITSNVYPSIYVSPFKTYTGNYKTFKFKTFFLELPEEVVITSNIFDGLKYQIHARGKNLYEISAIPFEQKVDIAKDYMKTSTEYVLNTPMFKEFVEKDFKGIYAERDDEDNLMLGESFCFIKDGFTFYILSYGAAENYYSAFDIAKNIKPLVKPITEEEKENIILNIIPKYQKECQYIIQKEINQDVILQNDFKCTNVEILKSNKTLNIKCTLEGDYSQLYPGQKEKLKIILSRAVMIKPYSYNIELLGYQTSIGFYKPSGEKIKLQ